MRVCVAFLVVAGISSVTSAQLNAELPLSLDEVRQIAADAVKYKQFEYKPPRAIVEPERRIAYFQFENFSLSAKSPMSRAIRAQAFIDTMKAGYGTTLSEEFWQPRVAKYEDKVREMVIVANGNWSEAEKIDYLDRAMNGIFYKCDEAMRDWAVQQGWDPGLRKTLCCTAWKVQINAMPLGEIKIMHEVEYICSRRQRRNIENDMTSIANGANYDWSGTHYILCRFKNGAVLGPLKKTITERGVLTLTPQGERFVPLRQDLQPSS